LERAAKEEAVAYWGDETGVSNCETVERGFAPKGHPPVLPVETKRERVNMLSAISSQGSVRFMVYRENMEQRRLIQFMQRIVRLSDRKVFLILDNLKVHHGKLVSAWLEKHKEKGANYRICWGLVNGGRPTSELPSHLMNHAVKVIATNGRHRVIYYAHPANTIALTFVLPLTDEAFTRELWEMATECPVVFPDGIGMVPWMVPGGRDIAVATSELMQKYDVAIWAHHGMFCSGEDFDLTFGLMHTVEKSAEVLVKVRSMVQEKQQTIQPDEFLHLAEDFKVKLPEKFLYEKK